MPQGSRRTENDTQTQSRIGRMSSAWLRDVSAGPRDSAQVGHRAQGVEQVWRSGRGSAESPSRPARHGPRRVRCAIRAQPRRCSSAGWGAGLSAFSPSTIARMAFSSPARFEEAQERQGQRQAWRACTAGRARMPIHGIPSDVSLLAIPVPTFRSPGDRPRSSTRPRSRRGRERHEQVQHGHR